MEIIIDDLHRKMELSRKLAIRSKAKIKGQSIETYQEVEILADLGGGMFRVKMYDDIYELKLNDPMNILQLNAKKVK